MGSPVLLRLILRPRLWLAVLRSAIGLAVVRLTVLVLTGLGRLAVVRLTGLGLTVLRLSGLLAVGLLVGVGLARLAVGLLVRILAVGLRTAGTGIRSALIPGIAPEAVASTVIRSVRVHFLSLR